MTEEDKALWAEKKTEKGQEEKDKKGMNCEKFKEEESLDSESLYEQCLAQRALCKAAKESGEEEPEECTPPEKKECDTNDKECKKK